MTGTRKDLAPNLNRRLGRQRLSKCDVGGGSSSLIFAELGPSLRSSAARLRWRPTPARGVARPSRDATRQSLFQQQLKLSIACSS